MMEKKKIAMMKRTRNEFTYSLELRISEEGRCDNESVMEFASCTPSGWWQESLKPCLACEKHWIKQKSFY